MTPSFLFVHTYYPQFLEELYLHDSTLVKLPYDRQHRRILDTGFGISDAYSDNLRRLGCEAWDVIVNADLLQNCWADEYELDRVENIHDRRRQIIAAQIKHYNPDILYIFEWCPLGDGFLADVKSLVRLIAGQVASPLHSDRTYAPYDVMFSSYPPIVDYFKQEGKGAEHLKLAFDVRILENLSSVNSGYDVTFVGGFAPSHPDRIEWLEKLLQKVNIDVFGYGVEKTDEQSPIRSHHRGPVWGLSMHEVLHRSRITLNRHACIDVRGQVVNHLANNMRLYEATGVGTCLITEQRDNLTEMFTSDREIVTYTSDEDCLEKIQFYLSHEKKRSAIAHAGKQRTFREHTYLHRMTELLKMVSKQLQ